MKLLYFTQERLVEINGFNAFQYNSLMDFSKGIANSVTLDSVRNTYRLYISATECHLPQFNVESKKKHFNMFVCNGH